MISNAPSLLCPVDFSESSRRALAHAAVIAGHFGARLIVLRVNDPIVTEPVATVGTLLPSEEARRELQRFCGETLASFGPGTIEYSVRVGTPATEILREARDRRVDVIVMSSRGRSGSSSRGMRSSSRRRDSSRAPSMQATRIAKWNRARTSSRRPRPRRKTCLALHCSCRSRSRISTFTIARRTPT